MTFRLQYRFDDEQPLTKHCFDIEPIPDRTVLSDEYVRHFQEIARWVRQQYGLAGHPTAAPCYNYRVPLRFYSQQSILGAFWFRDTHDAFLFRLRWS